MKDASKGSPNEHGGPLVPLSLDVVVVSRSDGVDVTRRDGVDSDVEGSPLDGERLKDGKGKAASAFYAGERGNRESSTDLDHVDATGLGGVVASLLLGEVNDVTRHGSGDLRVEEEEDDDKLRSYM
jgi:hypothetical protein